MDMNLIHAEPGQTCSVCGELPPSSFPRLMDVQGKTGFQALFCCNCSIEFFVTIGISVKQAVAFVESAGETVH